MSREWFVPFACFTEIGPSLDIFRLVWVQAGPGSNQVMIWTGNTNQVISGAGSVIRKQTLSR
ncbi:MAG: hypothetical protein CMF59_09495 [Leptospiraceae bacterium]|nr:hypothetical protein [Leptospiraceae bacterium]